MADSPETSVLRRSQRLVSSTPINYYSHHLDGADENEIRKTRLNELQLHAQSLGFNSLYDAVVLDAEIYPEICEFVESGGLNSLYQSFRRYRIRRDDALTNLQICEMGKDVYQREWRNLVAEAEFQVPAGGFSPTYLSSFSFNGIFERMQTLAPCFCKLLATLAPVRVSAHKQNSSSTQARLKDAQQRRLVTAISVLGSQTSERFNALQTRLNYFLFASRVSKRVLKVLNRMGIVTSYEGMLRALKANAAAIHTRLSTISQAGEAIWISYDNLTFAANVKQQTLFNAGKFVTATAGYVVKPAKEQAHPMFTPEDVDYRRCHQLTLADFIPSTNDKEMMLEANRFFIFDVMKRFASGHHVSFNCDEPPMPVKYVLNKDLRPEIIPLPTYPYNEGVINEVVDLIHKISNQIGLSEAQITENVIMFKGDFLTVRQNR